jgi:phosphatidylserine/phosphatidylglycerophosphate/cardiolipin synthase-like enzyme
MDVVHDPAVQEPRALVSAATQTVYVGGLGVQSVAPPASDWPRAPDGIIRGPMRVHTFVSPDCSFQAMRELLGRATRSLLIYIYNASSDDMLRLVSDSVGRGVSVRIMYDRNDTSGDEVAKLERLGAELRVAPSFAPRRAFTVCHQKFAVIDSEIVIVESANWAVTSIPNPGSAPWKKGNREWFIALESREAAKRFIDLFELDWKWRRSQHPSIAEAAPVPVAVEVYTGFAVESPPPNEILPPGQFDLGTSATVVPLFSPQNYFRHVKAAIDGAEESVWIEQQYIKASGSGSDVGALLERLRAKRSKIEIRIVSSAVFANAWDDTLATLERYGLRGKIKAIDLREFTHCHNKGVIIDGKVVVVSSTNWSDNSIGAAREAGVMITNAHIARYYARAFDFDWRTGMRPHEVEAVLTMLPEEAPSSDEQVHPADLV